jgi:hypothetical protein
VLAWNRRGNGSEWWRDGGLRPAAMRIDGGSTPVPLDGDGVVRKLPGDVVELRPGSNWVRRGRKREFHGGQNTAAMGKLGELVGKPMQSPRNQIDRSGSVVGVM